MASQSPPKKNAAYTFDISVWSQADSTALKSGPTIAAGDFKISTDGSALANLANLPTATGVQITIVLTSGEMNGDRIFIYWQDASGAEWIAGYFLLMTSARLNDDLAFPTVSGRSLDVTATGGAGIDWANVENPTTTLDLSGTSTKAVEPTVAGRTLDVTATGAAGIDLANVENQGSTLALTATTVANLTNAPTSGDLTAAMKASVTTAATAATPTAAAVTGAVGSVTTPVVVGSTSVGALDAGSFTSAAQNAFADKLLDRDMSTGTDSGSPTVRTPRQALRVLRNKVDIPNGKVKKEDDTTDSWTFTATTAAGDPVTVVDPA